MKVGVKVICLTDRQMTCSDTEGIGRQAAGRYTYVCRDRQTGIQTDRQTDIQTDGRTDGQRDGWTDRQTKDRQAYKQTDRQDRQTDEDYCPLVWVQLCILCNPTSSWGG